jgi:hypothetical protein
MTSFMDSLAYNGTGGAVLNPVQSVSRSTTIATSTSIIINWTAPLTGGLSYTGFKIIFTTSATTPDPAGMGPTAGNNATSYTYNGLSTGTTYYAWVFTTNSLAYSTGVSSGAMLMDDVPGQPTNPADNPPTSTTVGFSWSAPITGGTTLYYYASISLVNVTPNPITAPNTQQIALGVNTVTFSGLTPSTTYYVWLWAANLSGLCATPNTEPIYTLTASISTPSGLYVDNIQQTQADIHWIWGTPYPGDTMLIFVQTITTPPTPGTSIPSDVVSYPNTIDTVTFLTANTTYYVFIAGADYVNNIFTVAVGPYTFTTNP